MKVIYCFSLALFFISCSSPKEDLAEAEKMSKARFFNLKEFVESDIKKLTENGCKAQKTGTVNGEKSAASLDEVDWKLELEAISQADINKSSWIAYFEVDTLDYEKGQLISYSTQNSDIPIRKLEIFSDSNSQVVKINIERLSKNLLFESKQNISYLPGKSFEASGSQKAIFMKAQTFSILTEFECP